MTTAYFLGIDIGTQGARTVLIDETGNLLGSSEEVFSLNDQNLEEQSPFGWWQACLRSLKILIGQVKTDTDLAAIKAVSVTSTSGTVIPLDINHEPLHNALMYSDTRSSKEGILCKEAATRFNPAGYTGFNSSSGLSKMVWFVTHFPDKVQRLHKWIHAADYLTGKLCNRWGITDYTNALKSGYDLSALHWPEYIYTQLPLKKEWLPEVIPSGTRIGTLDTSLAAHLGLKETIRVVAGMTDGCASQIASGAVNPGDWNTTIGTTMVIKGVTRTEIKDPLDRIYSHRHPQGFWMPGGASNTGADWVTKYFKDDLKRLNEQANSLIPTGLLAYPLQKQGERFPFSAPLARGFEPEGLSYEERYTANMEGVAYIERYAYDMIGKLSGEKVGSVYTAGGGSNSDAWLTIRSNVMNKPIFKMKYVTGAVGAAILAASKTHFTSVAEAAEALTQVEKQIHPQPELAKKYNGYYFRFLDALQHKGYITNEQYA